MQPIADVEAFLANKPVEAILVNVAKPVVEEPIKAPGGPIPSVLCHSLGSNIQHILKEIDMDSKEFMGMGDNHMGHPMLQLRRPPPKKPLSPIPEAGASSWAPTPKRPRSPIFDEVDKA